MALFAFEHVSRCVADGRRMVRVLDDVCFEVDRGDFVGLWGMRRSGKSMLLRVAAGVEAPDEGRVWLDGVDLAGLSADERAARLRNGGVALVSCDWRPSASQEVVEHVAVPLLAHSLTLRQARRVACEHLERVGVLGVAHVLTDELSIGEAMRVGLAHALAREPRVLLVDEPAALPSPSERQELYGLLCELGASSEVALLVASEDLGIVRRARRKMTIGSGTLRCMDREGQVLSFPQERVREGRSG